MKLKKEAKLKKIDYPDYIHHGYLRIESIKSFAIGISIAGIAVVSGCSGSKTGKNDTEPKLPHATATKSSNVRNIYDSDHDGIADNVDKCPSIPEDKDNYRDEDGCPDPDNDKDGIPDIKDKCPNEPENKNGYNDDDGCPDRIPLKGDIAPVRRIPLKKKGNP